MNLIKLDAKLNSRLDWKTELEKAEELSKNGELILWELDLGLFHHLPEELSDQQQFLSLELAINHFTTHVYPSFKSNSLGVILYNGSLDFHFLSIKEEDFQKWLIEKPFYESTSNDFLKKIYLRDICFEYIKLLACQLPEDLAVYVKFEANTFSPAEFFQIFSKDALEYLQLLVEGSFIDLYEKSVEMLEVEKKVPYALCLPSNIVPSLQFDEPILKMLQSKVFFKIIPESLLNQYWQEVDYLIVFSNYLSTQGLRKIKGFLAAGGTIVSCGNSLNLPQEITFEEFFTQPRL